MNGLDSNICWTFHKPVVLSNKTNILPVSLHRGALQTRNAHDAERVVSQNRKRNDMHENRKYLMVVHTLIGNTKLIIAYYFLFLNKLTSFLLQLCKKFWFGVVYIPDIPPSFDPSDPLSERTFIVRSFARAEIINISANTAFIF